jgi:site-specific DNA-adenine methylase
MTKNLSEIERLIAGAGVEVRPYRPQPARDDNGGDAPREGGIAPPFSYFGGKRKVAAEVWARFGADIQNYIEPCAGGLAVLLNRPASTALFDRRYNERINDRDCLISNFWRAVKYADPAKFLKLCDYPYSESELIAWHYELVFRRGDLQSRLERDVYSYDLEAAARWVWGSKGWIGSGFGNPYKYIANKAPRAVIAGWPGGGSAEEYIRRLSNRLRHVLVLHGDWKDAVSSDTVTTDQGVTGVFFDPPYPNQGRADCYAEDDGRIADDILRWAVERGEDARFRIAFCGYIRHHDKDIPAEWKRFPWNAGGGYANQGDGQGRANAKEEMIWFSPGCLKLSKDD